MKYSGVESFSANRAENDACRQIRRADQLVCAVHCNSEMQARLCARGLKRAAEHRSGLLTSMTEPLTSPVNWTFNSASDSWERLTCTHSG